MKAFNPTGHYLVIELDFVPSEEEVTTSGIVIVKDSQTKSREQTAMPNANVISIGPNCWVGHYDPDNNWQPWCKVGDKIMIAQFAGQKLPVPDSATQKEKDFLSRLRLIKDDDVLAVEGEEEWAM